MSAFHVLGKVFSAKRKWTMDLLSVIFKASLDKDNKHAEKFPDDFEGRCEPYDKKNGVVRYCFTRCPLADFVKTNDLGKWMPLMCNCDYCIVSEDNPFMQQYELVRNEDGLLVSKKKK